MLELLALAILRESVVLRLRPVLPGWLGGVEARLRIRVIHRLRAFSYLAIWCNKQFVTARDSFEDIVTEILHEHLLFALHVLDDHVLEGAVGVLLEGVLVFHNACSAFLIPHLDKYCSKVTVRGVGTGLGRQLSNGLDDVSVHVNARGTDFTEHLPHHVKVRVSCGGKGEESHC